MKTSLVFRRLHETGAKHRFSLYKMLAEGKLASVPSRKCRIYDIKGRRYIDSPYKYYFEDLGFRNARLGFCQTEATHMMENMIYNELRACGFSVDVYASLKIGQF